MKNPFIRINGNPTQAETDAYQQGLMDQRNVLLFPIPIRSFDSEEEEKAYARGMKLMKDAQGLFEKVKGLKGLNNDEMFLHLVNQSCRKNPCKEVRAKGYRGLILDIMGKSYFRIYHGTKNKKGHPNFSDFEMKHNDMAVIIDDDSASFYETIEGRKFISENSRVFGKKKKYPNGDLAKAIKKGKIEGFSGKKKK